MANRQIKAFFKKMESQGLMVTYSDVRFKTEESNIIPRETDVKSRFSRRVSLNIPMASSAMDKVTEWQMATAMALKGGIGIIHRGLSPEDQSLQVTRVKYHLNRLIATPITVNANDTVGEVLNRRAEKGWKFHSFPVIDNDGVLVGLMTRNDFEFCMSQEAKVKDVMTPYGQLVVAPYQITRDKAYELLLFHKKKVLPLVDENLKVKGMYLFSDLMRSRERNAIQNVDSRGQLRVGAAVGVGDSARTRAALLASAGCDVFVIDTAHGFSKNVMDTIRYLKRTYADIDVVAGNVSTREAAARLAAIGVDGVMVGQGPGSICTTRIIAGIGAPQVSAIFECADAVQKSGIPICADGGITSSGDITIALGVGAESVMGGYMFAGTDETPGEVYLDPTRNMRMKAYRGMGSLGAMHDNASSRERYRQATTPLGKVVPEGVEAAVPYRGPVADVIDQYVGGLQQGMGYIGARSLKELRKKARIFRSTSAGFVESHPHNVHITHLPPNYNGRS